MRKQSILIGSETRLWVLLITCSLSGCGEPFLATVGVWNGFLGGDGGGNNPNDAGDSSRGDGDARDDAGGRRDDAQVQSGDAGVDWDASPGDCITLIDQGAGQAASDAGVQSSNVQLLGCQVANEMDKTSSSIWWREDGDLMMTAGLGYSFYWPKDTSLFGSLRLYGGESPCDVDKIHEQGAGLAIFLAAPGCAPVSSTFDVHYLRMSHTYANWTATPLQMRLCRGPCVVP